MVRTIHSGLDYKRVLTKIKQVIKEYLQKLAELEKQYVKISKWKFLKRARNKRKREVITREFKVQMLELGLSI